MSINNREKEIDLIIAQAKKFNLVCETTEEGKWIISSENWQLSQLETKWLLSVKERDEIYLDDDEVLKFLERQWQRKFENSPKKPTFSPSAQKGY